jgi:hypothetical protein
VARIGPYPVEGGVSSAPMSCRTWVWQVSTSSSATRSPRSRSC